MRAGKLRHQITILQVSESRTGSGGVSESWSTYATVWASIEPLNGREYLASQQRQSSETHKVRIRYLFGITTKMRVLWGSRTFDIQAVLDTDENGRETVLMCVERGT